MGLETILAAAALAAAAPDPLAPSQEGLVECSDPDDVKKTCQVLSFYRSLGDGAYSSTDVGMLPIPGAVTLEFTSRVTVRDGKACGVLRAEDLAQIRLFKGERPMSKDEAAPIMALVNQVLAPITGRTICGTYEAAPNGFKTTTTVDGVRRPEMDTVGRWIKLSDGYVLTPEMPAPAPARPRP